MHSGTQPRKMTGQTCFIGISRLDGCQGAVLLNRVLSRRNNLYQWKPVQGWLTTTVVWGGFLCVMVFVMVCINSLVPKTVDRARETELSYYSVALELTSAGRTNLLTNRMMWLGFGIAGAIDILNGLHDLYPTVPSLGGRLYDLRPFFTQKPWECSGLDSYRCFSVRGGHCVLYPA